MINLYWRFEKAENLRACGYLVRARSLFLRNLREMRPEDDPVLWMDCALGVVRCSRSLGDGKQSQRWLSRAKSVFSRLRLLYYADSLGMEEALLDRAMGRFEAAVSRLRKIMVRVRTMHERAYLHWALGGAYRFMGRLHESETHFRISLGIARRQGDGAGIGYALCGLGGTTRLLGKARRSESYYRRALKIFGKGAASGRTSGDLFGRAYSMCGLANALRQQGRWKESGARYRRALKIYRQIGDEADAAYVEWGLGKVYEKIGKPGKAIKIIRHALEIFRRHREARGEVLALISLAALLHAAGRTAKAERLHKRAMLRSRVSGIHTHLEQFT